MSLPQIEQQTIESIWGEKSMKAKKAMKKLKKAQLSLSNVVGQWSGLGSEARDLLSAAGQSVNRALGLIDVKAASAVSEARRGAKTAYAKAMKQGRGAPFSEERRQKLSLAAKRRWAAAKRLGAKTLAG
jgi:predicted sugar kinase